MNKNNWTEKFGKIMEKMERRRNNTEKAREDLATIMETLTNLIPDKMTGYNSKKSFFVKASWWNGSNWVYFDGECYFKVINGKVCVVDEYSNPLFSSKNLEDIADYINFEQMVPALIEFIDNLLDVETWDKETEVISRIKDSLSQVNQA